MNQGKWTRKAKNGLNIAFINGVNSGEDCWRNKNGSYWPKLLENENNLDDTGIYLFSYRTGLNTGTYSLSDIVDSLREYFVLDDLINSAGVIFVCHSMGGIVARRFLVNQYSKLIERGLNRIGLFLVASPSLGSKYANMLGLVSSVMGHAQASALKFSQANVWLNDLDKDFIKLIANENLRIKGKELIEDLPLYGKGIIKRQIVEPFSGAKYFGDSFKVPGSDHSTIATPSDKDAVQHRLLVQFIKEFIEEFGLDVKEKTLCDKERARYTLVINREVDETELSKLAGPLTEVLQRITGDSSLIIRRVNSGSIEVVVESSSQAFEMLQELHRSGELSKLIDMPVSSLQPERDSSEGNLKQDSVANQGESSMISGVNTILESEIEEEMGSQSTLSNSSPSTATNIRDGVSSIGISARYDNLDAAEVIAECYTSLVSEAIIRVSNDYPDFKDPRGFENELTNYLRVIQYCFVIGGTGPLDELVIAGQREVFVAFGISRSPYIAALTYMKNSSLITQTMSPRAQSTFALYVNYLISALS
jgi:hypothetical protein